MMIILQHYDATGFEVNGRYVMYVLYVMHMLRVVDNGHSLSMLEQSARRACHMDSQSAL